MGNPKKKKKCMSSGNMSFCLGSQLTNRDTPSVDLTSLSQGDPGMCGISNAKKEPPNIFLCESDVSDVET